jgi:two-component system, LytTR family, sensor kinase
MPESFVGPAVSCRVGVSLWSHRTRWGTMFASPPARAAGSPPAPAVPLIPGHQRTVWILILGGWTIVGLGYFCSLVLTEPEAGGVRNSWLLLLAVALGTAWIWAALTPVTLWLTRKASFAPGRRASAAVVYTLAGLGFFLVSGTLEWLLWMVTGTGSGGYWSTLLMCVETRLLAYLAIVTLGRSAYYFGLYRTRQHHTSELEARLAKTHLQVLRMQLQPHFLFNTLNTVAELVHTDPDTADQMITRLGRLLRLSLDHAGHQVVPLRQEIEFLRMYVEIEQVRFQDRLQIMWDLAPDTLDAAVPPLLWHPVLENAIRHGVTPLAGRGRIVIASRRDGQDLILEIRDNGMGPPPGGVAREGVGLRNIRERVGQLYGPPAHFTLETALGGGTTATLRIPFTHCDTAHTPVPVSRSDLEELTG